jgi:hypothetical protein
VNILFRVWTARTDLVGRKLDLVRPQEALEKKTVAPFLTHQSDVHLRWWRSRTLTQEGRRFSGSAVVTSSIPIVPALVRMSLTKVRACMIGLNSIEDRCRSSKTVSTVSSPDPAGFVFCLMLW